MEPVVPASADQDRDGDRLLELVDVRHAGRLLHAVHAPLQVLQRWLVARGRLLSRAWPVESAHAWWRRPVPHAATVADWRRESDSTVPERSDVHLVLAQLCTARLRLLGDQRNADHVQLQRRANAVPADAGQSAVPDALPDALYQQQLPDAIPDTVSVQWRQSDSNADAVRRTGAGVLGAGLRSVHAGGQTVHDGEWRDMHMRQWRQCGDQDVSDGAADAVRAFAAGREDSVRCVPRADRHLHDVDWCGVSVQ